MIYLSEIRKIPFEIPSELVNTSGTIIELLPTNFNPNREVVISGEDIVYKLNTSDDSPLPVLVESKTITDYSKSIDDLNNKILSLESTINALTVTVINLERRMLKRSLRS